MSDTKTIEFTLPGTEREVEWLLHLLSGLALGTHRLAAGQTVQLSLTAPGKVLYRTLTGASLAVRAEIASLAPGESLVDRFDAVVAEFDKAS